MSAKVRHLENLPSDAWRTHLGEDEESDSDLDMEKNSRRVRKDKKSEKHTGTSHIANKVLRILILYFWNQVQAINNLTSDARRNSCYNCKLN